MTGIGNEECGSADGLHGDQVMRLADKGGLIDVKAGERGDTAYSGWKLVYTTELFRPVELLKRQLNIFSFQALAAGKKFMNGHQEEVFIVSRNRTIQRMNDRVLLSELASFRKESSIASRHYRYSRGASSRPGPETAPKRIVVHHCRSYASDTRSRVRHIGVFAMNAGAAGTVLIGKHSDYYITEIIQFILGDTIDVVFDGVQFHERRKVLIRSGPGWCWINVRAGQSVIEQATPWIARFDGGGTVRREVFKPWNGAINGGSTANIHEWPT
jgi:hypothetical protein